MQQQKGIDKAQSSKIKRLHELKDNLLNMISNPEDDSLMTPYLQKPQLVKSSFEQPKSILVKSNSIINKSQSKNKLCTLTKNVSFAEDVNMIQQNDSDKITQKNSKSKESNSDLQVDNKELGLVSSSPFSSPYQIESVLSEMSERTLENEYKVAQKPKESGFNKDMEDLQKDMVFYHTDHYVEQGV